MVEKRLTPDPNFATLESDDEYARYFNQLAYVFERLLACYHLQAFVGSKASSESRCQRQTFEAKTVAAFIERLLYTIKVLRVRYTHQPEHERSLWVDLTESGLPNFAEFSALERDLRMKESRLRELPAESILRRALLDCLFSRLEADRELLWQLSQRTYLELLDLDRLLLPFSMGELVLEEENSHYRKYVCSWACYDSQSNRAYVHIMTFDQDRSVEPLEVNGAQRAALFNVLKGEGGRAPSVGVLALAIDDALEYVHPKILKRICMGPLYSKLLLDGRPVNEEDPREAPLRVLLDEYAARPDDFVIFFFDEIVFSKRQEITPTLFSLRGRVREVFAIPETDPDLYARRASLVHRHMLLPHSLLQHITPELQAAVPDLLNSRKLTFDEKGTVYGV